MKNRKTIKKNVKGITLIALVVTIIVLLILAGIAINLTIENNGLFSRVEDAANTWRRAEANEQEEMKNFESLYDETVKKLGLDGNSGVTKKPIGEITGNEKTKIETTDKAGNRIAVPAGFKVVNPEATVNEGIIIEDVSANNSNTVGNQFVWVPCTLDGANESLKYDRYAFTKDDWEYRQIKLNEQDADGSYKIKIVGQVTSYYHEAMSEAERQSVQSNGGYYIGRYEVGCDTERTEHTAITEIAKVKAGLKVYNYVTRDEAVAITEGMYAGKSRLCSSYAWDTALQFIGGTYAVNSTGDNCETNNLENTGYHVEKNIYDMGGNVSEWTTENHSNIDASCIDRGGSYRNSALQNVAGYRGCNDQEKNREYIGIRCTLYV